MKKRLKKGEVRAIKINEDALYELIRETMQEKCADYFDLFDQKYTEHCLRWNKTDNSLTYIVYNYQDRSMVNFDAIDDTLDITTNSLFTKPRYVTLDVRPNEAKIMDKFLHTAIRHHNMLLFTAPQMLEIIHECEQAGMKILGFDGFKLYDGKIQPFLEHSVDYSSIPDRNEICALAKTFIAEKTGLDLVFELVLE